MKKTLFLIGLISVLFSCSEENIEVVDEVVNVEDFPEIELEHDLRDYEIEFADFYYKFSATIESRNYEIFNGFIHQNYGCYMIQNSDSMPSFVNVYDVGEFVAESGSKRFFDLSFQEIDHVVSFEALPNVLCDKNTFDKVGCYASPSDRLIQSEIWKTTQLTNEEILDVEKLLASVNIAVVNTYNYSYHFSKIEDEWYVTFIDLRAPCSI